MPIKAHGWERATGEEIVFFYENMFKDCFVREAPEYVQDIANVLEWACVSFDESFIRGKLGKEIVFDSFDQLQEFLIRNRAISAYYGTGNLFTVDIDSKDVAKTELCQKHPWFDYKEGSDEYNQQLEYIYNIPPRDYGFCFNCVKIAVEKIHIVRKLLIDIGAGPDSITVYYSGQGAHLECNDPNMLDLDKGVREYLASYFSKQSIPVDKVVTYGMNRVFRIPGSLHGKVNRIKSQLSLNEQFDLEITGIYR